MRILIHFSGSLGIQVHFLMFISKNTVIFKIHHHKSSSLKLFKLNSVQFSTSISVCMCLVLEPNILVWNKVATLEEMEPHSLNQISTISNQTIFPFEKKLIDNACTESFLFASWSLVPKCFMQKKLSSISWLSPLRWIFEYAYKMGPWLARGNKRIWSNATVAFATVEVCCHIVTDAIEYDLWLEARL